MVRKCRKTQGMVEASSTYMILRSRRIIYVDRSEKNISYAIDNDEDSPPSCCESNNERFIDLEEERDCDIETSTNQRSSTKRKIFENLRDREMENSADFDSTAVQKSADCGCSGRRESSTEEEEKEATTNGQQQPTEVEIEEFFVEAEKQLNDKFKKK